MCSKIIDSDAYRDVINVPIEGIQDFEEKEDKDKKKFKICTLIIDLNRF